MFIQALLIIVKKWGEKSNAQQVMNKKQKCGISIQQDTTGNTKKCSSDRVTIWRNPENLLIASHKDHRWYFPFT